MSQDRVRTDFTRFQIAIISNMFALKFGAFAQDHMGGISGPNIEDLKYPFKNRSLIKSD